MRCVKSAKRRNERVLTSFVYKLKAVHKGLPLVLNIKRDRINTVHIRLREAALQLHHLYEADKGYINL